MFTDVATPRPGTPLWDVALKHRLFKIPAKEPFAYLAKGMNLPGVTPFQVTATWLQANYVKTRMAIENGNVNLPVLFGKARKSLWV